MSVTRKGHSLLPRLLPWLLLGLLPACQPQSSPNASAANSAATGTTAVASAAPSAAASSSPPGSSAGTTNTAAADSQLTGVLSEEAFKKLHEKRRDTAPAPTGKMLALPGGSRAYLSLPANAKAPLPAVVVIHEWWGLNQHIKHWSDRLAADGYAALAVDLYGGKVASEPNDAMTLMRAVDDKAATAVLVEAAQYLKKEPRVMASRRASIGWCFGGRWSLELALADPSMTAAVVYYGHVTDDAERLAALKAPLLGVFGNQDSGIPPAKVNAFASALKTAGKEHKILRYDAQHAFANPSSARYQQQAAEQAWGETRAFLKQHLKP